MEIIPKELESKLRYHYENDTGVIQTTVNQLMGGVLEKLSQDPNNPQVKKILDNLSVSGGKTVKGGFMWSFAMVLAFFSIAIVIGVATQGYLQGLNMQDSVRILVVCSDPSGGPRGEPNDFMRGRKSVEKEVRKWKGAGVLDAINFKYHFINKRKNYDKESIHPSVIDNAYSEIGIKLTHKKYLTPVYNLIWFAGCNTLDMMNTYFVSNRETNMHGKRGIRDHDTFYVFTEGPRYKAHQGSTLPDYFIKPSKMKYSASLEPSDEEIRRKENVVRRFHIASPSDFIYRF